MEKIWSKKYEKCINCGTINTKYKGNGLCTVCYNKLYEKNHKGKCSICKKERIISTRKNNKIICKPCYKKYYYKIKKRKCIICERVERIDKIIENKPICRYCNEKYFYNKPKDTCHFCGDFKPRIGYKYGKPICGSCYRIKFYKKPKRICDNCNKEGYINIIINGKKFCRKCYKSSIRKNYYLALDHKRRGKIKGGGGNISEEDFNRILERDKSCVYCGSKQNLTFDHILPISKGGKSDISNYVLACSKCNISKGKKNIFEWCKQKGIEVPNIIKLGR